MDVGGTLADSLGALRHGQRADQDLAAWRRLLMLVGGFPELLTAARDRHQGQYTRFDPGADRWLRDAEHFSGLGHLGPTLAARDMGANHLQHPPTSWVVRAGSEVLKFKKILDDLG